jgi:hypothetical protein
LIAFHTHKNRKSELIKCLKCVTAASRASALAAEYKKIPMVLTVRQLSNDAQPHGRRAIDERAILHDRIPPGPNGLPPAVETLICREEKRALP